MERSCWVLGLIVVSYLLHAFLVYIELKERLSKYLMKHPIIFWGAVTTGAAVIAIPALPYAMEYGNTLRA